jgi:ubiquinone/menaquinone biosynthesis C-methylase UbiE
MGERGEQLDSYIIKGGREGKARLSVLARVLAPTTEALFDRFEPFAGRRVVDAGCGGGDVSFHLAERVGPDGCVIAFDLDEDKLSLARQEADEHGIANIDFRQSSVLDPWPSEAPSFAYARFVLTHLQRPETMLGRALASLAPGGVLVVEDIDFDGSFCDPPNRAYDDYAELYVESARKRGCDPFIGRRLVRLLEDAGFADVGFSLVQPYGRAGDVKQIASLTFHAIADTAVKLGLATPDHVEQIKSELADFTADPRTTTSLPRIFQAWGYKR